MPITTRKRILKVLQGFNPWWIAGLVNPMLKLAGLNEVLECCHENICADQNVYYRGGSKDKEIDIVVNYPNILNDAAVIHLCDSAISATPPSAAAEQDVTAEGGRVLVG